MTLKEQNEIISAHFWMCLFRLDGPRRGRPLKFKVVELPLGDFEIVDLGPYDSLVQSGYLSREEAEADLARMQARWREMHRMAKAPFAEGGAIDQVSRDLVDWNLDDLPGMVSAAVKALDDIARLAHGQGNKESEIGIAIDELGSIAQQASRDLAFAMIQVSSEARKARSV
jgi:hypothetical protein